MLSVMDGFLLAWRRHGIGESDEDEGDVLAWEAMRLTTDDADGPSAGPASVEEMEPPSFALALSFRIECLALYSFSARGVTPKITPMSF